MTDPLSDVTIVELTQMVAGSHAGMVLGDLGAEVIKVERPGSGEIARSVEPRVGGESFYYMSANRGKRSVALDLKTDSGREAMYRLLDSADVFLENLSPGTVADLGIGYETIADRNPTIVYCSVSAFGQTGPSADRRGIDPLVQAYTGIPSITRDREGNPLRAGVTVADLAGAMYAIVAILAALRRREIDGEGDYLDVALSDSLLSFLSVRAGYTFATGEPFPSVARSHVYFVPEGIFPTADGYIQVSVINETDWAGFCRAIDREEWIEHADFRSVDRRREHRDRLIAAIEDELQERGTADWIARFEAEAVPVQAINDLETVWEDAHTQARGMIEPVRTPGGSSFETVDYPVKNRTWEREPQRSIATLGADTEAVLREVGLSEGAIRAVLEDQETDP